MVIHRAVSGIFFDEIERLNAIQCAEGIITMYLCARPAPPDAERPFLSQFRQALHRFRRRTTDPNWLRAAEREKARIEDYLRWRRPVRGSLVLFSCQPVGLWEIFDIDIRVPIVFDVGPTVRTEILAEMLDEHPIHGECPYRTDGSFPPPGAKRRSRPPHGRLP